MNSRNIAIELKWLEEEYCSIKRKPQGRNDNASLYCYVFFLFFSLQHLAAPSDNRWILYILSINDFKEAAVGSDVLQEKKNSRETSEQKKKWPWAASWKHSSKTREEISDENGHLGGWLLICPHGRPSLRQTEGKSLKVIITTERMSAGRLGSISAPQLKASRVRRFSSWRNQCRAGNWPITR